MCPKAAATACPACKAQNKTISKYTDIKYVQGEGNLKLYRHQVSAR